MAIKLATVTTAPVATVPAALVAYRTQRDMIVRECLFLRAEIAHLRCPNPLDTDHDAIKALGAGITELQGRMAKLRKASATMIHRKPLHVIKASEPVLITGPGARPDLIGTMTVVPAAKPAAPASKLDAMAAVLPVKAAAPTPYEVQQARKAKRGTAAPKADRKPAERAVSNADVECALLLARENGATVAELRAATGWKGPIMGGPLRAAKAAGKVLKWDGAGEARRFTLA